MSDEPIQSTEPQKPPVVTPSAETAALEDYIFPTYGKTIRASSLEEANAKLQESLKTT